MCSLVFGVIVDRACGNVNITPVTKVFTEYCDLLRAIFRWGLNMKWTEFDSQTLKKGINKFWDYSRSVLEEYQVSGMRISKRFVFQHIVNLLTALGGIEILHAFHYEKSHQVFKRAYQRKSRKVQVSNGRTFRAFGFFIVSRNKISPFKL